VAYSALRRQLLRDRAVLEWPPPPPGLTVEAPELRPGVAATVTVTLANDDVEAYEGVELSLTGPWNLTPTSPAPTRIEPGETAEATWTVTAPPQAEPAAAGELRARASYAVAGSPVSLDVAEPAYVVEPAEGFATFATGEAHFGARGDRLAVIAGGADLWTGIDEYGALFLDGAGGPGTVAVARLVSQDPTDPNARAGLAMRNDLTGAGRAGGYVLLVAKPQNGFLLLWDADGSGTVESVARSGPAATPSPAWLRLARNGTTFTGAWSVDGVAWTTVGTATVPSAAAVQDVGVVVCSHAASLGRAVFDRLEVRTSAVAVDLS
jgi:alpha-galactosidase-like protein